MKYGHIETETNKILGWYDDSIHESIPKPNIELTEEQWREAININANYYENETFSYKEPTPEPKTEAEIIAEYKTAYLSMFNTKLAELDYDDLATVGLWAIKDGSKFQAEAKTLLNWYEAIINKNYEILNAVKSGDREMPTKEEYLAELPQYSTYEL